MKRAFTSLVATACVFVLTGSALAAAPATAITPENAGQVAELKRIGGPTVNSAAISPDGRLVAVATSLAIELRDATKLNTIVRTLEGGVAFRSVAFSPDGQLIAGGGKYGDVFVWQTVDGQLVRKLERPIQKAVSFLQFSQDARSLAGLVGDVAETSMLVWDVSSGKVAKQSEKALKRRSAALSFAGQRLALTSWSDYDIRLLDFSGKPIGTLAGHTASISSLAFSSDGQTLASGASDGTVQLWSAQNGRKLRTISNLPARPLALSFSSDSRLLAGLLQKSGIVVWDLETGKQVSNLRGSSAQASSGVLHFGQDDKLLLFASSELRILKMPRGNLLSKLALSQPDTPDRLAFSSDGEMVARSFIPGRAKIERASDGRQVANVSSDACCWTLTLLEDVLELVNVPVSISPQKRMVALSVSERRETDRSIVIIQDLKRGTRSESPIADTIFSLAFSPDEELLAAGGYKVHLVNTRSRRIVQTLEHAKGVVISLAFSSNGQLLATASTDGIIRLWQVADGKLASELPKQEKPILSVAFSPDNALLATAGADRVVRLWRVADGKPAQTLKGHESLVGAVAFSADGTILASGALDGAINLWQVSDGKLLKTLKGHTDNIMGVAFMKDGRLASASSDGTTRLWGVK
jgi:WD40 repeat protein